MSRHFDTQAFQKCCRDSVKNTTTQGLHVKKWVEGCEICAKAKRVPNTAITPELLILPEWDLGPEDAMQINLLPNLPTSGGYQTVMTAFDVFSIYLFAYLLI